MRYATAPLLLGLALAVPYAHGNGGWDTPGFGHEDGGENRRLIIAPDDTALVSYFPHGDGDEQYEITCMPPRNDPWFKPIVMRINATDIEIPCNSARVPIPFHAPRGLSLLDVGVESRGGGDPLTAWDVSGTPLYVYYDFNVLVSGDKGYNVRVARSRGGILFEGPIKSTIQLGALPKFNPVPLERLAPAAPLILRAWYVSGEQGVSMGLKGDGDGAWGLHIDAPDAADGVVRDGRVRWNVGGVGVEIAGAVRDGMWDTDGPGSIGARVTAEVNDAPNVEVESVGGRDVSGRANVAACNTNATSTCSFDVSSDLPSPGQHQYHLTLTAHIF